MRKNYFSLYLFVSYFFLQSLAIGSEIEDTFTDSADDNNESVVKEEAIRIIKPGVFDYQAKDFLLRMRAWGVGFPRREQPGYNEAISFAEGMLLGVSLKIDVKQEFDPSNLKVVQVIISKGRTDFSREAIAQGIGWHLDKETNRYGPYVLSQLKAKRLNLGVWARNFNYQQVQSSTSLPTARLPGLINNKSGFVPSLSYWVTSFGRIHRPGCSFYQRGRGSLSTNPKGIDCRICGGKTPKK
jgi:hypothetical protein